MMSRKIDLMLKRIQEQNDLDQKYLSREAKINSNLVQHLTKQREDLHNKTEQRERRIQEGKIRNELARLGKTTLVDNGNKRRHTFDSKMNTFTSMDYLLYPSNKNNIYTHINNYNYVFDKKENYRKDYNNGIINKTWTNDNSNIKSMYNFQKKKYFADIFDNLYNQNNDKKFLSNDILFFLNRAVSDELKENKDYEDAIKYEKYMNYLKNKNDNLNEIKTAYTNKHIDAKTKYNDFYLDQDDLLNKKVNDLREGKNDGEFYKTLPRSENEKKSLLKEKMWKKKRDEKMKKINEENLKKYNAILLKETNKFNFANKKEDDCLINKKNAMLGSLYYKENMEQKAKEAEIRNDRVFKAQTVYKKGEYEMQDTH